MAHIDVNLDAVEDQSGECHPEGQLLIRIAKAEIRDNKEKTGKYINWQLNPVESENKKPVFLMTSLKPEALWNLKQFLKAAGVQWHSDGSFDTEDAMGQEVWVTIIKEVYEGNEQNKVKPPYKAA